MAESRHTFPASARLSGKPRFDAVYAAGRRESRGPLLLYSLPNSLGHLRLGLSVSRRIGSAVQRNAIKRLLREAFRLLRHDLPQGYDLVIVVRRHENMMLAEYQKLLQWLLIRAHQSWTGASRAGADQLG